MIEATNKLRDEDLQDIQKFEEKVKNEYKKFKIFTDRIVFKRNA